MQLILATVIGLAAAQPSVSYELNLQVGSLTSGDEVGVVTRGAQPWDRVRIVAAGETGRTCPKGLGACIDLSHDASVVGRGLASARGEVLTIVPADTTQRCFQAVAVRDGAVAVSEAVCVGTRLAALGL